MCVHTEDGRRVMFSPDRSKFSVGPHKRDSGGEWKTWVKMCSQWQKDVPFFASTRCSCNHPDEPKGQIFDPETGEITIGPEPKTGIRV